LEPHLGKWSAWLDTLRRSRRAMMRRSGSSCRIEPERTRFDMKHVNIEANSFERRIVRDLSRH